MKHIWNTCKRVECDGLRNWHWFSDNKLSSGTNIMLPFHRSWTRYHSQWHRDVNLPLYQTVAKKSDVQGALCRAEDWARSGSGAILSRVKGRMGSPLWVTSERGCFAPFAPLGAWHLCAGLIFTGYWYETYFFRPKMRLLCWVKTRIWLRYHLYIWPHLPNRPAR